MSLICWEIKKSGASEIVTFFGDALYINQQLFQNINVALGNRQCFIEYFKKI